MEAVSATVTQTSQVNQTQQSNSSSNINNEQNSAASFDEEMKNAQKETSQNNEKSVVENKEVSNNSENKTESEQIKIKNSEKSGFENSKNEFQSKKLNSDELKRNLRDDLNSAELLSINIQNLIDTQNILSNRNEMFNISINRDVDLSKNIGETLNYQNIEMTENDAIFFADLVQNNEGGIQNIIADIQQAVNFGDEAVQKSATISKALLDALQNTVKTGQAVRIDFGRDVAVIMRVSKDGSVMANFIPGDKAVENYLKNNIDFLRQRFEEEDIPYSQLSYSQHQQKEKRQQNKEDRNE